MTRLAAAMLRHGLSYILTFNAADFVRSAGIHVVSPHDLAAEGWTPAVP
jgi:hypothetical protein